MIVTSPMITKAATNPRPNSNGQITIPKVLDEYPTLTKCARNSDGSYTIEGPAPILLLISFDSDYTVL